MSIIYYIDDNKQIKEADYIKFIESFAQETTTPFGVMRANHIEEVDGYAIGEEFYTEEEAHQAIKDQDEDDDTTIDDLEPCTEYRCLRWDATGAKKMINKFYFKDEAEDWLFKTACIDYWDNDDAPMYYDTLEEAQAALDEILAN